MQILRCIPNLHKIWYFIIALQWGQLHNSNMTLQSFPCLPCCLLKDVEPVIEDEKPTRGRRRVVLQVVEENEPVVFRCATQVLTKRIYHRGHFPCHTWRQAINRLN